MIRIALALILFAAPALASQCIQLSDSGARVWNAALKPGEVRILYVGHSAFRVETDQGRAVVTDYFGANGPGPVPDAVTMNIAHETHWTAYPDPAIAHPLKGWPEDGAAAEHWVELDDLLIRNVPTDIRGWNNEWEPFGNSIFIFEYEGLCIGHLGHLHHEPREEHYARIGRLDVLMAPVDGGYTIDIETMLRIAKRLKSRVVLPMHAFSNYSLAAFLEGLSGEFRIESTPVEELVLSAAMLPAEPTVYLMQPAWARPGGED